MRIISQNGKFDLPYENLAIFVEYENVIARFENERYLLGQYSSEAKAIKAMEMLRETYVGMPLVMQNVTISEDVAKEFERLKKCGIMVRTENQPSKVDFINNAIFQFPQDEDVEINNGLE